MAIISVNLARGSTSDATKDTTELDLGYVVITDGNSTAEQVRLAPGIPRPNTLLLSSGILIVRSVKAKNRDGSTQVWDVDVHYEAPGNNGDPEQQNPDPLARPPVISFNFNDSNVPFNYEVDADGVIDLTKPVVNSAGDGFDPQPEREVSDAVVQIVKNEASFTIADAKHWHNAVNSTPFAGIEAGCIKLKIAGASREVETVTNETDGSTTNVFYWKVTRELHIRDDGWDTQILNKGLRRKYIGGSSGTYIDIITVNGKAVTEPVALNDDGFPRALDAEPPVLIHKHKSHKRRDINTLGLT